MRSSGRRALRSFTRCVPRCSTPNRVPPRERLSVWPLYLPYARRSAARVYWTESPTGRRAFAGMLPPQKASASVMILR
jgi:hypothetical protein